MDDIMDDIDSIPLINDWGGLETEIPLDTITIDDIEALLKNLLPTDIPLDPRGLFIFILMNYVKCI